MQTYNIVLLFRGKCYNYYTLQLVEAIQHHYLEDFTSAGSIDTQATSTRLDSLAGSSTAWSTPIRPPAGKPSAGTGKIPEEKESPQVYTSVCCGRPASSSRGK